MRIVLSTSIAFTESRLSQGTTILLPVATTSEGMSNSSMLNNPIDSSKHCVLCRLSLRIDQYRGWISRVTPSRAPSQIGVELESRSSLHISQHAFMYQITWQHQTQSIASSRVLTPAHMCACHADAKAAQYPPSRSAR